MMAEASFHFLDAVQIDDGRQFIEFRFVDFTGEQKVIQIDFDYVESLAAVFQQAFIAATVAGPQGSNRRISQDFVSVPRADLDHPVSVGIDVTSGRIVTMFLFGSPFQVCYSLPTEHARTLSHDLLAAYDQVRQQNEVLANRPAN
jgi:hypothetical protein